MSHNLRTMQRIAVIGSPGAGKTTFSKKLATRLELPLHHLDYYYFQKPSHQPTSPEWQNQVSALATESRWVIDGNYKSTFEIRFARADTIIFLDYPFHVSMSRAILRRIKYHSSVREDMPPTWKEKLPPQLVKLILLYGRRERPKLKRILDNLAKEKTIITFSTPQQANQFLGSLVTSPQLPSGNHRLR